jgi:hypothetical protein
VNEEGQVTEEERVFDLIAAPIHDCNEPLTSRDSLIYYSLKSGELGLTPPSQTKHKEAQVHSGSWSVAKDEVPQSGPNHACAGDVSQDCCRT